MSSHATGIHTSGPQKHRFSNMENITRSHINVKHDEESDLSYRGDTWHRETELDKWTPVAKYTPEFVDTELDIPDTAVNHEFFDLFVTQAQQNEFLHDVFTST